ncbi:MAG TPA: trypsin-like peptidase domain-containing protein [Acidimicrobiia bacterium]
MSAGSPEDEGQGGPSGSPPDPMDRLWVHPAELGARMRRTAPVARGGGRVWLVGTVAGAVGAIVTVTVLAAFGAFDPSTPTSSASRDRLADDAELVAQVVAQAGPSVVGVTVAAAGGARHASAVCIGNGEAITSADVLDGGGPVTVTTVDGRSRPATVAGRDLATDLAVVRFDDLTIPPAKLGSADALQVGRQVIAVGVGGIDQHWVSTGVISSLDGLVEARPGRVLSDMVQTDNTVTTEAGGGALVDRSGVVVGILSPVHAGSGGFATPVGLATDVAQQLLTTGKAVHGWLGVAGSDRDGHPNGVQVSAVTAKSPAATAGLVPGDVITEVDGRQIDGMAELMADVRRHRPGDQVDLTVVQGDRSRSVVADLGAWADTGAASSTTPTSSSGVQAALSG